MLLFTLISQEVRLISTLLYSRFKIKTSGHHFLVRLLPVLQAASVLSGSHKFKRELAVKAFPVLYCL